MRGVKRASGAVRGAAADDDGYGYGSESKGAGPSESRAAGLLAQADAAAQSGDRVGEIQLLKKAIATRPSAAELERLLSRLCDAEVELSVETTGCERLLREFPRSDAAKLAQRRLLSAPASAGASKSAMPSKSAPVDAAPAKKAKAAEQPSY
jgi:hypothetical protein